MHTPGRNPDLTAGHGDVKRMHAIVEPFSRVCTVFIVARKPAFRPSAFRRRKKQARKDIPGTGAGREWSGFLLFRRSWRGGLHG